MKPVHSTESTESTQITDPVKPGYQTSEFWLTAVTNIVAAIVAILAFRGLLSGEEGELWLQLAQTLAATIAPIVIAIVTAVYTNGRSKVKATQQ